MPNSGIQVTETIDSAAFKDAPAEAFAVLSTAEDVSQPDYVRLVREQQRVLWRRGTPIRVESWVEKHPAFLNDTEAVLDLVYNEIVLREELGERPELAEYVERFPAYPVQLQRL